MGKMSETLAGQRLQSLELAESLESQGRSSVALRVARALLRGLPAEERELSLRAQLCIARSHLRLGASDQAAAVLKDLEHQYGGSRQAEPGMRIALERGRLHYLRSEWHEAEAVLMQAMEHARALGQGNQTARILRMLSMVYREAGSIPLAEDACRAATEAARGAQGLKNENAVGP
jgi:tetratricopeptide (TPR) repeat protein